MVHGIDCEDLHSTAVCDVHLAFFLQGLAGQGGEQPSPSKRKRRADSPPGERRSRGRADESGENQSARRSARDRDGAEPAAFGGPASKRPSNNKCEECGTTETPTWRRWGPTLLCNACGLRRKKNPKAHPPPARQQVQPLPAQEKQPLPYAPWDREQDLLARQPGPQLLTAAPVSEAQLQ